MLMQANVHAFHVTSFFEKFLPVYLPFVLQPIYPAIVMLMKLSSFFFLFKLQLVCMYTLILFYNYNFSFYFVNSINFFTFYRCLC